jgi:hypothetical protein
MRRLIVIALIVVAGCTPAQSRSWWDWHRTDPQAAEAFMNTPSGRRLLADPAAPASGSAGNCASFAPLFRAYGLPVAIFERLAWRESGCNPGSFVMSRTDSGGGLLGINLKGRLAATWRVWCGATLGNITNATVNVRCAAAAYRRMGLRPWS